MRPWFFIILSLANFGWVQPVIAQIHELPEYRPDEYHQLGVAVENPADRNKTTSKAVTLQPLTPTAIAAGCDVTLLATADFPVLPGQKIEKYKWNLNRNGNSIKRKRERHHPKNSI